MALETPLYMQPASGDSAIQYSARQDRAGLLSAIYSREGVLDVDAGQLRVTQRSAGANMSVDVAAGRCAIFGDDVSDQGTYVCNNTTPVNLSVPARPASGSRTHRVIARVRDKLANGVWTTYDWTIEVLVDSGSGVPSVPNSAISLATVTVTSSSTSVTNAMITDSRPRATVGTPALTGAVAPFGGWYGNASNPPRYSVTPDGLVLLSGVIYRGSGGTFTAAGATYYEFATLPAAIRPQAGRLLPILAQAFRSGVAQFNTDGIVKFAFPSSQTVTQDVFWLSLDGLAYRIGG